ncbi:MAG TPA: hypothetical protein VKK79_14690, partial [Candidatus Lokiarchaeia archaeon]|nr:hypothetical protein [Candidatus Lokiarchaeia archaeon]
DDAYVTMKDDPEMVRSHRWASNNSVLGVIGMDYDKIAKSIAKNGEPGILYLDNARKFSRMGDAPDWKDKKAMGVNPCITGDTLIATADGRIAVPIKQLADEGKDIPVYCKDTEGITQIRMMRNPRITGYDQEIYEVLLDDGSKIRCTGNHEFLLRNLTKKAAGDLKPKDSLMVMPKWQSNWEEITGIFKGNGCSNYWMINNGKKNIFEHTMIYEQLKEVKIEPGCVIHHRDFDGLNNQLLNLDMMHKEEHDHLHDISGNNNPMRKWWLTATETEKFDYRKKMSSKTLGPSNGRYSGLTNEQIYDEMVTLVKTSEEPLTYPAWKMYARENGLNYTDNKFRGSIINLIKCANNECGFEHIDNPALMREYKKYIKLLKESDLEVIFHDGIWVIRRCENCNKEFQVKYAQREQAYCSRNCSNKINAKSAGSAMKQKGKRSHLKATQKIYDLFDQYVSERGEIPSKSEFLVFLIQNGINDFRTAGIHKGYQFLLDLIAARYQSSQISARSLRRIDYKREMATKLRSHGLLYNHKVISVLKIGRDVVYNGTVDEFHNYGIILKEKVTKTNNPRLEIIFTANCGEQTLESFELCCLCETFPSRHDSWEEFRETLKYAYLYAKSVTLLNTHWKETNAVMGKNRRIGVSQSGIVDAFVKHGRRTMLNWCDQGYKYLHELDDRISDWLCVPKCIKITTVKPSGTVSLLPGVSPGIHYPHAEYYIRRVRVARNSRLVAPLQEAGYHVEEDAYNKNALVVDFPIHEVHFDRAKQEVSIWEQMQNAADYQRYWSDNQVSITVTFRAEEAKDITHVLQAYEDKIKGASFLPLKDHGYVQAPYEEITQEQFEEMTKDLQPINLEQLEERSIGSVYCDGENCQLDF